MRIRLTLLPVDYPAFIPANHHPLAAFLYQTVASVAPELAGYLHDEGLRPGTAADTDRRFKFFVFAVPELPRYEFQGDQKRFLNGAVSWQISSPLPEFIQALLVSLSAQPCVRLGRTDFTVTGIELLPEPMFTDCMRFITLSPLTVATSETDPNGRRIKHYLRAGDPRFGTLIRSNLLEKYRALSGTEPENDELHFEFDQEYIRQAGGIESWKLSRLIQYKETRIKAWQIPFVVSGNPELIRLGWESGFGNASSQGFGMAGLG